MNWSKELLSCSVHEVARETKETRITRAVPSRGMANVSFMISLVTLQAVYTERYTLDQH